MASFGMRTNKINPSLPAAPTPLTFLGGKTTTTMLAFDSTKVNHAVYPAATPTYAATVVNRTVLQSAARIKPADISKLEPSQPLPVNISTRTTNPTD